MSSGPRQLVVNALERAVSTDIMRGQNFSQATLSELLRGLFDTSLGTDDAQAGGLYNPNLTQGTPAAGEIITGLLFTPSIASVGSVVGAGVVALYDPDAAPSTDDSQYKLIQDPGTSLLTLTANSSGSARIDIVECARVQPDNVVETDSRDVFNTVTGLFAAATVNKVTAGQLQYRIRLGTPGSGFPGFAAGWLPLVVASVPTGTTTWDTVTLWDVRPSVSDRVFGGSYLSLDLPRRTKLLHSSNNGGATAHQLNGIVEVEWTSNSVFGPVSAATRAGGRLRRGSPGTDFGQAYVDFADTANQDPNITLSGSPSLAFYYLCFPFGLPRWARYSDAAAGARVPQNPRGIPLISKVVPGHVYGQNRDSVQLPAVFGMGAAVAAIGQAVCFGATTVASGSILGQVTSDGWTTPAVPVAAVTGTLNADNGQGIAELTENVQWPAGATRIRLLVTVNLTFSGVIPGHPFSWNPINASIATISESATQFTTVTFQSKDFNGSTPSATVYFTEPTWVIEVELPNRYPTKSAGLIYNFDYDFSAALPSGVVAQAVNPPTVQVLAWKM